MIQTNTTLLPRVNRDTPLHDLRPSQIVELQTWEAEQHDRSTEPHRDLDAHEWSQTLGEYECAHGKADSATTTENVFVAVLTAETALTHGIYPASQSRHPSVEVTRHPRQNSELYARA